MAYHGFSRDDMMAWSSPSSANYHIMMGTKRIFINKNTHGILGRTSASIKSMAPTHIQFINQRSYSVERIIENNTIFWSILSHCTSFRNFLQSPRFSLTIATFQFKSSVSNGTWFAMGQHASRMPEDLMRWRVQAKPGIWYIANPHHI